MHVLEILPGSRAPCVPQKSWRNVKRNVILIRWWCGTWPGGGGGGRGGSAAAAAQSVGPGSRRVARRVVGRRARVEVGRRGWPAPAGRPVRSGRRVLDATGRLHQTFPHDQCLLAGSGLRPRRARWRPQSVTPRRRRRRLGLITSVDEIMFSSALVCLFVCTVTQKKLLNRFWQISAESNAGFTSVEEAPIDINVGTLTLISLNSTYVGRNTRQQATSCPQNRMIFLTMITNSMFCLCFIFILLVARRCGIVQLNEFYFTFSTSNPRRCLWIDLKGRRSLV